MLSSLKPLLSSRGLHVNSTDGADSVVEEPGVHTLSVEQVETGQPPHPHTRPEV